MLYIIALAPGASLALFLLGVSALTALGVRIIELICKLVSSLISKDA